MAVGAQSASASVKYQTFIGGRWIDAANGAVIESEDPFSGEIWALVPRCGAAEADQAVEAADKAFASGAWPAMTASARGQLLFRLGDLVAEHAECLAKIEVRDNGKLMAEMRAQTRYHGAVVPLLRRPRRQDRRRGHPDRQAGHLQLHALRAARRRRARSRRGIRRCC